MNFRISQRSGFLISCIFLGCLLMLVGSNIIPSETTETCNYNSEDYKIELVISQQLDKSRKKVLKHYQDELIPHAIHSVKKTFIDTKIGLTTFSNFASRTVNLHDECYQRLVPLTDNIDKVLKKHRSVKPGWAGNIAPSLLSASLAVTDKKMGWSGPKSKTEKKTIKLVALLTSGKSFLPGDTYFGKKFKGTSSDSCWSEMPHPKDVGHVYQIRRTALLPFTTGPHVKDDWDNYFESMTMAGEVNNVYIETTKEEFADMLLRAIEKIICDRKEEEDEAEEPVEEDVEETVVTEETADSEVPEVKTEVPEVKTEVPEVETEKKRAPSSIEKDFVPVAPSTDEPLTETTKRAVEESLPVDSNEPDASGGRRGLVIGAAAAGGCLLLLAILGGVTYYKRDQPVDSGSREFTAFEAPGEDLRAYPLGMEVVGEANDAFA